MTLTAANLIFLLHATLSSKLSPLTRRLRSSGLLIASLFAAFALSTWIPNVPQTPFFYLVLLAGAIQSGAGSYMNTAVFALGALFGPTALQSAMAGQAAAGVLVSIVQLITTYSALRAPGNDSSGAAAFWFFTFSTAFMLVSLFSHAYVARQRAFRRVVEPFEEEQIARSGGAAGMGKDELRHIARVTKANVIYNATVAFVFATTLVRLSSHLHLFSHSFVHRAYTPLSRVPSGHTHLRRTHPWLIRPFSLPRISSCSTLATGLGGLPAASQGWSSTIPVSSLAWQFAVYCSSRFSSGAMSRGMEQAHPTSFSSSLCCSSARVTGGSGAC
jgi:hypothetical protein